LRSLFENNPVGAVLVLAASLVIALGAVLAVFREAIDLVNGSPEPEPEPVTFSPRN